jgi:hypothetical protein
MKGKTRSFINLIDSDGITQTVAFYVMAGYRLKKQKYKFYNVLTIKNNKLDIP